MNDWIKDFNVIYKGELYKSCVCVHERMKSTLEEIIIERLMVVYVDENGVLNVIDDNTNKFKFVRK